MVWTQMSRMHKGPTGKWDLRFRSGVTFPDLSETDEVHLRHYMASMDEPATDPVEAEDSLPGVAASSATVSSNPKGLVDRLNRSFLRHFR
jgi:hypothetical protein